MTPLGSGGLYDLLVSRFGVGSGPVGGEPYYRYRLRQIGQLKRLLERHHTTPAEMVEVAEWMTTNRRWATTMAQVFEYLPAMRRDRRPHHDDNFEQAYAAAVAFEAAQPQSDLYGRLVRAHGTRRREVYQEWRQTRSR